jgi:hypothetical protein
MERKIAALLGAVAGLATIGTAQAAVRPAPTPTEALQVSSYADLLVPIANPVELLRVDDATHMQQPAGEPAGDFVLASDQHHHHHHHNYQRRQRYSRNYHHHHHHHSRGFVGAPGIGGVIVNGR